MSVPDTRVFGPFRRRKDHRSSEQTGHMSPVATVPRKSALGDLFETCEANSRFVQR